MTFMGFPQMLKNSFVFLFQIYHSTWDMWHLRSSSEPCCYHIADILSILICQEFLDTGII